MSNSPMGYNPFKMKAGKDSGYDNSPMKKNYGQFGVGSSEMPEKPTPNKMLGVSASLAGGAANREAMEKMKENKQAEMAANQGVAEGGGEAQAGGEVDANAAANNERRAAFEAKQATADEASSGGGKVAQHGPEAHTGGGGGMKGLKGSLFGSSGSMGGSPGIVGGAMGGVGGMLGGGKPSNIFTKMREKAMKKAQEAGS